MGRNLRTEEITDKDGKHLMSFLGGSGEQGCTARVCLMRTGRPGDKMNQGEGLQLQTKGKPEVDEGKSQGGL